MFNNILVIGSGVMGQGIAALLLSKKLNVTLITRSQESKSIAKKGISKALRRLSNNSEKSFDLDCLLSGLSLLEKPCKGSKFDVVIEAVVENTDVKKALLKDYQDYVRSETIWATNTSSLSITDMASSFLYPDRLIGLHFFNPVTSMELVEVIPSMLTSEETVCLGQEFCKFLGKHPVKVLDNPGFIVNRLLIPMINEAVGILETQVATAEEIDIAMKYGAHHPLGPLALADLIGNDVCLSIMDTLYSSTGDSKYRPTYLLRKMVNANKLGRKTSEGFYVY